MTTLCAGCGHDSITAAIIQAFWELSIAPHRVAKLSGIGCSSKTPAYFLREAHGFNCVHGRMPALVDRRQRRQPRPHLHRHLGRRRFALDRPRPAVPRHPPQREHALRAREQRRLRPHQGPVLGVGRSRLAQQEGRGQHHGARSTACLLALTLGATFVARSFSGDKAQLVPILKAGLAHQGFAFVDVISPCVTFNDHEGSTKSYAYTRENNVEVVQADFVPPTAAITTAYDPGTVRSVMMHDGSWVRLRKVAEDYDPTDRDRSSTPTSASGRRRARSSPGLLYISPDSQRRARAEQHRRHAARPGAVRAALPRECRAREAAARVQIGVWSGFSRIRTHFNSFSTTSMLLFNRAACGAA